MDQWTNRLIVKLYVTSRYRMEKLDKTNNQPIDKFSGKTRDQHGTRDSPDTSYVHQKTP